jgi:hypothetical protein
MSGKFYFTIESLDFPIFANRSLGPPPLFFFLWRLCFALMPPLPPVQCSSPRRRCAAPAAPPPTWSASTRHSSPVPVLFPLSAVLFCTRHDHPSSRRPPPHRRRVPHACRLYFPPPYAQQHQQLILDPFPPLFPLPCAPRIPDCLRRPFLPSGELLVTVDSHR